jgi:hypothetical protein
MTKRKADDALGGARKKKKEARCSSKCFHTHLSLVNLYYQAYFEHLA